MVSQHSIYKSFSFLCIQHTIISSGNPGHNSNCQIQTFQLSFLNSSLKFSNEYIVCDGTRREGEREREREGESMHTAN